MTAPKAKHHDFEKAEAWMRQAFGMSMAEYLRMGKRDPFGRAVKETTKIIELAGIRELIEEFHREDHPSGRGRKSHISETSALVALFVAIRVTGTISIQAAADLLIDATHRELELMRIEPEALVGAEIYDRLWRAVHRLKDLLDRFPGDRRSRPTKKQLKKINKDRAKRTAELQIKHERMNRICNQLIDGTWRLLPKELRDRMHGAIALDATAIRMSGMQKNIANMTVEDTASVNYDSGYYVREGNHDGSNAKPGKRMYAWEIELATMTRNGPKAEIDAPLFIVAMSGHRPGQINGEGKRILDSLISRSVPVTSLIADRAYLPGAVPEDLQLPFSAHGSKLVMDYPIDKLGKQTFYRSADGKHNLVMCDGSWYLATMPETLQEAESTWAKEKADAAKIKNKAVRDARLAAGHDLVEKRRSQRTKYRLTPRGRHNADGSRQYFYPTGLDPIDFDKVTGEQFDIIIPGKTVKVPGLLGRDNRKHLKYGQEYEYKSKDWRGWYGLRNTVESVNSRVKDPQREGLHEPFNRRGRGPWFAELAAALAAASQNLRRLVHFLQDRLALKNVTAKNRNQWMTYAIATANARVRDTDAEPDDGPPDYYLLPVWELLEE